MTRGVSKSGSPTPEADDVVHRRRDVEEAPDARRRHGADALGEGAFGERRREGSCRSPSSASLRHRALRPAATIGAPRPRAPVVAASRLARPLQLAAAFDWTRAGVRASGARSRRRPRGTLADARASGAAIMTKTPKPMTGADDRNAGAGARTERGTARSGESGRRRSARATKAQLAANVLRRPAPASAPTRRDPRARLRLPLPRQRRPALDEGRVGCTGPARGPGSTS